jgi:hypothetical protein
MSDHNQKHGQHGHENDQVESSSIQPRPILMFLVILGLATAFVFVVVKGLDWGLRKMGEESQGQPATQVETQSRKLPPEPLLQGAPGKGSTATTDVPTELPLEEMARVRKETAEKANSYGWIDKANGVARIPIERAKEMIAEKGLPSLPTATIAEEVRKAETTRKLVLNADSSAGRMIKVQAPALQAPSVQAPASQPAPQMATQPTASAAPQQGQPSQHNQQPAQPQKH